MSAILGIFCRDSRAVDRPVLDAMMQSLAYRGPDGGDLWYCKNIGLGHQMLWTTPESLAESLPLLDRRKGLTLTADARIDNRDELMTSLDFAEHPHGEISDSELILGAYEKWGEHCPERLLGDFAFAIWDSKKRTLFCARDHMGVKPFYYYLSERIFVFGSEIKALLSVPEVPRRLNELRVAEYLVPTVEDKAITFYRDIFRLPPGHSMTVGSGKVSMQTYWSLDPSREVSLGSDTEYAEAFQEIFLEAVRCRLRSAYPVGSELSGGLDSSSVVCVARNLFTPDGSRKLHTFSAVYDEVPKSDERTFIEEVLGQGEAEPHFLRADQLSPLGDLEQMLWYLDEPFLTGMFVNWALQRLAHQQGVRVLLTGSDGDTVVNHGDAHLIELAQSGSWRKLAAQIDALSRVTGRSRRSLLLKTVIKPLTPSPVFEAWRLLSRGQQPGGAPGLSSSLLRPDFAQRIDLEKHLQAPKENLSGPARSSRVAHWRGITAAVWPYVLELSDKVGAAFATEYRHPFFDKRLVEFCLALPPEQKLSQGWSRIILRRAMADDLPERVRWRKSKGDQSHSWARSLLAFDRGLLKSTILEDSYLIEPYVDMDVLRETYQRFASECSLTDYHRLVTAANLASWLRQTKLAP